MGSNKRNGPNNWTKTLWIRLGQPPKTVPSHTYTHTNTQNLTKVFRDRFLVGTWHIRDGGQQDCILAVPRGDLVGVTRRECIIPQMEQIARLLFVQDLSIVFGFDLLWHLTAVMMSNLPLSVFIHVHKRVPGLTGREAERKNIHLKKG